MNLSVIVPTHNRPASLRECLVCLTKQTLPNKFFEIIIVDDGSTVDLKLLVKQSLDQAKIKYIFIKQLNRGPAEARNRGILAASGELVLFIGDDIMASNNFLAEHYNFHLKNINGNLAMLGFTTWSKDIKISDFMIWLEASGIQFGYNDLKPNQTVNYNYFYTSNLSLKRRFMLNQGLFNRAFPYAAFEDAELGYRLIRAGLKLIYNPTTVAYHKHEMTIEESIKRMAIVGKSAKIFADLHPELADKLSLKSRRGLKGKIKNIIIIFFHYLGLLFINRCFEGYYWKSKMLNSYIRGYDGC